MILIILFLINIMGHLATIKDIAKVLNISVSTVSRALRDTYDVNQETKAKVMEVTLQLNYKPNHKVLSHPSILNWLGFNLPNV